MASNNFINECKTPAYEDRLGKIVIDGIEYNQSDNLTSLELDDGIYNNGTIIGSTYTKGLKFSLINVDKDTEFVGKKAIPSVGVKYDNDTTEYIGFDEYTLESLKDEQTENFTNITGYDSLNILDTKYESDLDEGSHTIGEYWIDLVEKLGLETETPTFTNSTIVIPSNPFVNNESYRTVLSEIEKVSCSFCKVEKRTRTVNNQEEVYHVINLKWFDDYCDEEQTTINGDTTISDVYKVENVELLGNTTQNSTTGANILPQDKYIATTTTNGITFTNNGDGTFNLSGTASANTTIQIIPIGNMSLEANQPYYLYSSVPYNGTTFNMSIAMTNNGTKFILANGTYTPTATPTNVRLQFYIASGKSVNATNIKLMLVRGSTAPSQYEPYTGGQPSPSPSYPQEVHVVTGDNSINVCGKNLWYDIPDRYSHQGVTLTKTDDGGYVLNGTTTGVTIFNFNLPVPIDQGTYVLSIKASTNIPNNVFLRARDSNMAMVTPQSQVRGNNTTSNSNSFTCTTDIYTLALNLSTSGVTYNNLKIYPMIEKGSTATTYEPYQGNTYNIDLPVENLFDKDNANYINGWIDRTTMRLNTINGNRMFYIPCKPNTTYTISRSVITSSFRTTTYDNAPFPTVTGSNIDYTVPTVIQNNSGTTLTITTNANAKYLIVHYGKIEDTNLNETLATIQVEYGSKQNSYTPYGTTPIELCKIGNYQDKIFKGKGVNLFDYSYSNLANTTRATVSEENNGFKVTSTGVMGFGYSSLQLDNSLLGKQITISMNSSGNKTPSGRLFYVRDNGTLGTNVGPFWTTNHSHTETLPSTLPDGTKAIALVLYISQSTNSSGNYAIFRNIQVQLGNTATEYEPFNSKDKWLLRNEIGKVVLNGSENWVKHGSIASWFYYDGIIDGYVLDNTQILIKTNYYTPKAYQGVPYLVNGECAYGSSDSGVTHRFVIKNTDYTQTNDFKTWLSTHNTIVYYVLATPTTTEITDTELIEELDSIKLQKGLNNISLVESIAPDLKIDYRSDVPNYEFETSDYSSLEGSLTKYGPVNCVLLGSENISGENVYLQDDESISKNGETKVFIDSQYFLYTQALREQAIQGVYDKLNNFEYYDLSLTTYYGKPFLEVGNKIRINTNEGNVYDTFILQHTFTYDGTFKSIIKSPALTKQEDIVKSTESISSRVNRTEIMVDKANGEITSITSRTKYLEDNTYTIEQTNQLIQTAENGLINTFSEAGGNNILRNTGLWFSATISEQTIFPNNELFPSGELFTGNKVVYEFWKGDVSKTENDKAVNMVSLNLLAGYLNQEQKVPNGYYVVSFKYKKTNALANSKVKINDTEYSLTSVEDTDFTQIIEVSSQHINIQFYTDIDKSCEIYDLMVNAGQTKLAYSQNQNETTTDTVKIGQGITITSSNTDTTFKANSDGIRTLDKNGNELTKFTDTGMTTKRMVVDDDSQIVGTLWQEVGGQTWITRL